MIASILRIPVRGFAISTLHAYAEEGILDASDRGDEDMADVCAAVDAYIAGEAIATGATRYLLMPIDAADAVRRGLIELANTEDDEADARRVRDPEGARYSRAACRGLSMLAQTVARRAQAARSRQ